VGESTRAEAGTQLGRALAALGLALFFAGMFLVGTVGIAVYQDTDWTADVIDPRVPGYAVHAAALVLAGLALNRVGRVLAGR
jgi:hypothetical protein